MGIGATRREFLIPTLEMVSLRDVQFHLLDGTTFHMSGWRMPYRAGRGHALAINFDAEKFENERTRNFHHEHKYQNTKHK